MWHPQEALPLTTWTSGIRRQLARAPIVRTAPVLPLRRGVAMTCVCDGDPASEVKHRPAARRLNLGSSGSPHHEICCSANSSRVKRRRHIATCRMNWSPCLFRSTN